MNTFAFYSIVLFVLVAVFFTSFYYIKHHLPSGLKSTYKFGNLSNASLEKQDKIDTTLRTT